MIATLKLQCRTLLRSPWFGVEVRTCSGGGARLHIEPDRRQIGVLQLFSTEIGLPLMNFPLLLSYSTHFRLRFAFGSRFFNERHDLGDIRFGIVMFANAGLQHPHGLVDEAHDHRRILRIVRPCRSL
jgi:hypothetical protein